MEKDHDDPPPSMQPPLPSNVPFLKPMPNNEEALPINVPFVPNHENDEYAQKVKNFTELIFRSAELASTTGRMSPESKAFIAKKEFKTLLAKKIKEIFPQLLRTPDHPPYQIMISDAISSMNEDGGSTAGAISQYIKNKHPYLPYAHKTFLQHYLEQVCYYGAVVKAGDRYRIGNPDAVPRSANLPIVCGDESNSGPSFSISSSSSASSSDESVNDFSIPKRRRQPSRTRQRQHAKTLLPRATRMQDSASRKAPEKQIVVKVKEAQFSLEGKKRGRGKSTNVGKNKSNAGKKAVPKAKVLKQIVVKLKEVQGKKRGRGKSINVGKNESNAEKKVVPKAKTLKLNGPKGSMKITGKRQKTDQH